MNFDYLPNRINQPIIAFEVTTHPPDAYDLTRRKNSERITPTPVVSAQRKKRIFSKPKTIEEILLVLPKLQYKPRILCSCSVAVARGSTYCMYAHRFSDKRGPPDSDDDRSQASRARERERDGCCDGDGDREERVGRRGGGAAGLRVAAEEDHGGAVVQLLR